MDPRRAQLLRLMGIDRFEARPAPALALSLQGVDWSELATTVAACTRCALAQSRTAPVFGAGPLGATWLIVSEGPGEDEDRSGQPFEGAAGKLLTQMLSAVGVAREHAYLTQILKCYLPGGRAPRLAEVRECMPYLRAQIEMVKPRVILCLGRTAAAFLLESESPLSHLRGEVHRVAELGAPVVVTHHPGQLLKHPLDKREAWADLRLARGVVDGLSG